MDNIKLLHVRTTTGDTYFFQADMPEFQNVVNQAILGGNFYPFNNQFAINDMSAFDSSVVQNLDDYARKVVPIDSISDIKEVEIPNGEIKSFAYDVVNRSHDVYPQSEHPNAELAANPEAGKEEVLSADDQAAQSESIAEQSEAPEQENTETSQELEEETAQSDASSSETENSESANVEQTESESSQDATEEEDMVAEAPTKASKKK